MGENNKSFTPNSPEKVKENIKHNITQLRLANNLKKRDVAKALNIKENTYRIWEDPKRSCPKPHDILNLAMIYKVSSDFILTDDDGKPLNNTVHSENGYNSNNKKVYLTSLDNYEKLIVMNVRRLSLEGKQKIGEEIYKLLKEEEE